MKGFLNYLHVLPSRKIPLAILHDVSGIIKPGRLTLLLGPPSSGKTTLLLALAGELDPGLKVSGNITYNGHGMNEFVPQRTSAYISQHDLHLGELTAVSLEGERANLMTDYIIKILGLDVCADSLVGDAMLRGISGGQKKRVTTGEMMVGPARALFMDEISTGLDSSTTFQIVNSIKNSSHILQGTCVISLLQPAPETYDLFDDIILLSDGQIVYQGPRENVVEFFEHMGFRCPERKGVADFLQEVTSRKDQEQYRARRDEPYSFVTAREFAESFKLFHVGRELDNELSIPFDKAKSHPAALSTRKYGVSKKELLKALISREYLLMKRNSFVYIFKMTQLTIMAFIVMTVFLRTKMSKETTEDGVIFLGALFFTLLLTLFNGMSELALTIMKLPTFYKQRNLLFFPSWAFSLPAWILKIPMTFIEVSIYVFTTYYVIGFDPNVGRLFKMYLVLFCINQMASGLFRLIAGLGRNMIVANTFGSFALVTMVVLGGFVLSRDNIKKWWIWGYWVSPLMYGQNAISVNEFLGHSWKQVPSNSTESLGVLVLKSRGLFPEAYWYWIGVGALVGYVFLFNGLYTLALAYLSPFEKPQAILSEETVAERNSVKAGDVIELSSRGKSSPERGDEVQTSLSSKSRSSRNGSISEKNMQRGMVLPFEPLSIAFNDIKYSVDMPQEMKAQGIPEERLELLKGVTGSFRPGVLTALMGVSGAGKTTLMDVLAGRKTGGYIEGSILVSGYPKKQETFARIAGYCEQTDIHSPHVTVYESLTFSAWLRLPSEVDSATRKLLLMKRGGEEIYVGPLGHHSAHLISYFEGINGVSKIKDGYNPATWMLEVTSVAQEAAHGVNFAEVYKNSELYRHGKDLNNENFDFNIGEYLRSTGEKQRNNRGTKYASAGFKRSVLCHSIFAIFLHPMYGMPMETTPIILAKPTIYRSEILFHNYHSFDVWDNLLAAWLQKFICVGDFRGTQQDIFNAMGSMHSSVLFLGIQNATSVQPVVAVERTVFYREKAAGMYSALPYAFGQVVIELPYIFVQSVIYGVVVYSMIGFEWTTDKFFWYLFFMYFTLLYFTFYGMMAVAVTPNQSIAAIVASAFYAIWNLFSGFIIPKTRLPVWWKWYVYICPVSWTLYGLLASQFGNIQAQLDTGETVEYFVQTYFDFKHDFVGYVAIIIVGFAVLFAFLFAFSIKAFNFQRR
ncbi:hypothetical protein RHMOL_Rhmol07G0119900 [Rhododendron molle]|uniref:Uncharacterized protein n=1 Tax=Rhododendron molle TaxID=49168 RepID=A0ACC0N017_RHOML|nr:hypothetical protein RHMOL_Rhmol07G0119900 [Rhododendron molle]